MSKLKTTTKNLKEKILSAFSCNFNFCALSFKLKNKRNAFTLVEILTVVFLGSLIIMAAYSVYLMSYKSYKKQSEMAELTQNARVALERMSREIRQTNEILSTASDTEIKFQDGHVTDRIQYINYYRFEGELHRRVSHYAFLESAPPEDWVTPSMQNGEGESPTEYSDPNDDQVKAEKISYLRFLVNDDEVITIRLSTSDGKSTYTFETKTLARNAQ